MLAWASSFGFMMLVHPFTMVLAGGSGAGKSSFAKRLLKNLPEMTEPPVQEVIWSYSEWQDGYADMCNVTFVEGLPNIQEKYDKPTLLIIDDQMTEIDSRISQLFTRGSHHKNISVVLILQNLFGKNKELRTITLNCHFIVLFKNPRDSSQVSNLASQMYVQDSKFLRKVYADATSKPYSYLLLDYTQTTPDVYRLRTEIFPDDKIKYVYVRK